MVKSQHEVLGDLKALYLVSAATIPAPQRKYYALALLAMAAQWGVDKELSQIIFLTENNRDQLLPLPAAY